MELQSKNFRSSFLEGETETRGVLDIGSGKFKLLVAVVCGRRVLEVKVSKAVKVGLALDLASSSEEMLSEFIRVRSLTVLKELQGEAWALGAMQLRGIATAVFRKAKNGSALLELLVKETGIPLKVVSQEEEGVIGFHTASALCPEMEEGDMIVWDSGSASFQIVAKDGDQYVIYEGALGVASVAKAFLEEVRGTPYSQQQSINPLTFEECQNLAEVIKGKISRPDWLRRRLCDSKTTIVCIGDSGSIFSMAAQAIGADRYTILQVRDAMQRLTGLSNEALKSFTTTSPETIVTRVVFLCTVMEVFGINEVVFKESLGSTLGILTDPDFWRDS